jgi:hypothetical protein
MIYFIQAGEDGPIKIGRSEDHIQRFGGLKTGSYERLHIRAVLDVPDEVEMHYHDILSNCRIRGEWFDSNEISVLFALACAQAGHVWEPTCGSCGAKNTIDPFPAPRIMTRREFDILWKSTTEFDTQQIVDVIEHFDKFLGAGKQEAGRQLGIRRDAISRQRWTPELEMISSTKESI